MALVLMCTLALASPGATDISTSSTMAPAIASTLGSEIALTAADTNIKGAFEAASADKGKILKAMIARAVPLDANKANTFARKALVQQNLAATNKAAGSLICESMNPSTSTAAAISPPAAQAENIILQT